MMPFGRLVAVFRRGAARPVLVENLFYHSSARGGDFFVIPVELYR
jgi:hypothetical protein